MTTSPTVTTAASPRSIFWVGVTHAKAAPFTFALFGTTTLHVPDDSVTDDRSWGSVVRLSEDSSLSFLRDEPDLYDDEAQVLYGDVSQLRRGDVVLIPFPFADGRGAKRRPAVLVTSDSLRGKDGHFVFVTSKTPPPHVPGITISAGTNEARLMGLRFPPGVTACHILPSKIATLEVGIVQMTIGSTPSNIMSEIGSRLIATLGVA